MPSTFNTLPANQPLVPTGVTSPRRSRDTSINRTLPPTLPELARHQLAASPLQTSRVNDSVQPNNATSRELATEKENQQAIQNLITAAKNGDFASLRHCLAKMNINIQDQEGLTALMAAVDRGHLELAEFLLENNADVNQKDEYDGTALMSAACDGRLDMTKLLLKNKAEVNAQDQHGSTALICAAAKRHSDVIRLLLEHNAEVNHQDSQRWTALMAATEQNHPTIVQALLEATADVSLRTSIGSTALMIARENPQGHAVKELLAARESTSKSH